MEVISGMPQQALSHVTKPLLSEFSVPSISKSVARPGETGSAARWQSLTCVIKDDPIESAQVSGRGPSLRKDYKTGNTVRIELCYRVTIPWSTVHKLKFGSARSTLQDSKLFRPHIRNPKIQGLSTQGWLIL